MLYVLISFIFQEILGPKKILKIVVRSCVQMFTVQSTNFQGISSPKNKDITEPFSFTCLRFFMDSYL